MRASYLSLILFSLSVVASLPANAAAAIFSTGFSTPADFGDNFVALKFSGELRLAQDSHDGGLGLRKTGPGTVSVLYDTSAQGAALPGAGASGTAANANLENVELSATVRFANFNAAGFGLWSRVPANYSGGCLGLINIVAPDQVRIRIFGAGSTPLSASPGVLLKDATLKPARPLEPTAFYLAVFRTTTTPDGVHLDVLLRDTLGTLARLETVAPAESLPAKGQVGFRASSHVLVIDDFTITTP